jgi:hypothetical protein
MAGDDVSDPLGCCSYFLNTSGLLVRSVEESCFVNVNANPVPSSD